MLGRRTSFGLGRPGKARAAAGGKGVVAARTLYAFPRLASVFWGSLFIVLTLYNLMVCCVVLLDGLHYRHDIDRC